MDNDCTVLVIEDDDGARDALCEYLSAAGYDVRRARSGTEGLAVLASVSADAVLLDLVMPEPDGFEVLRRIRERDPRAPVIVMSGLSEAEAVVRAMKLGANDYLPKRAGPAHRRARVLVRADARELRRALRGPDRPRGAADHVRRRLSQHPPGGGRGGVAGSPFRVSRRGRR